MKKYFVDTNIVLDLLADRKPFSGFAIELFHRAEQKKLKLFTSSHALATVYYLLKKSTDEKKLRKILLDLTDFLTILAVTEDNLKKGLRSAINDLEDALQINCAGTVPELSGIITRNKKDFKGSDLPVFSPEEIKW